MAVFLPKKPSYLARIFMMRDWARIIVFFAFAAITIGIVVGAYAGFLRGFRFFSSNATYAYFARALSAYTLEAALFVVMVLVFASAVVSGLSIIFSSGEMRFLLSAPVPRMRLFASRFTANAASAAWPVALIGVPAIGAFARVYGSAVASIALCVALLAGAFLAAVLCATLFDLVLVRVFRSVRGWRFAVLVGALVLLSSYAVGRTLLPLNLAELFSAERFDVASAPVDLVFLHFKFFPTHAAVAALFGRAGSLATEAAFWEVVAGGAVCALAAWFTARKWYLMLLMRSFEGVFIARPEDRVVAKKGLGAFPAVFRGAYGALFEKEVLMFFRSGRETLRAFFLLLLLALYLFLFLRVRHFREAMPPDIMAVVLTFNLAVIGYFLTTLSLRFVFPAFSLEGKSGWALFVSPLPRRKAFVVKLLVGTLPFVGVVAALSGASARSLGADGGATTLFLRLALMMSVVLPVLALSFGALWPNFRDRDPDTLSTTLPGLAATGLSLFYVAFVSTLGFILFHNVLAGNAPLWWVEAALWGAGAALSFAFAACALRRLQKMDI